MAGWRQGGMVGGTASPISGVWWGPASPKGCRWGLLVGTLSLCWGCFAVSKGLTGNLAEVHSSRWSLELQHWVSVD